MSNETRPFVFRVHAAELFTQIQPLNMEQRGEFITQLSVDFLTLNPSSDYSKSILDETMQLIEKRKEAGKLGGRPKSKDKAKVKQRLSKGKAKPKQEEEIEVKEEKKDFAEKVKLTISEHKKLVEKYGPKFTKICIDKLSAYKLSKGKKYDSDYGAILTWVVDEVMKHHRPDNEVLF
jgi:hypothetical protein